MISVINSRNNVRYVNAIDLVQFVKDFSFCDEGRVVQLQNALYPGGDLTKEEAQYFLDSVNIVVKKEYLDNLFNEE